MSKPQKRLASHIMLVHKDISPRKRRSLCSKAERVTKTFIKKDVMQKKLSFTKKSVPSTSCNFSKRKKIFASTTREMPFFPLAHSKLDNFISYLQTFDGGNRTKTTAEVIAKDISKYLYYADMKCLNWENVLDKVKLLTYFEELKSMMGPEGILSKMERMGGALKYMMIECKDSELQARINSITELLKQWKYCLRKEKRKKAHERLELLSEQNFDLSAVKKFIGNETMWGKFDSVVRRSKKMQKINAEDNKFCLSAVMLSTLYESWSRPGAVINLKLIQFSSGSFTDDIYIVSVSEHKTGIGGTAKLMFKADLKIKVEEYINYIRPSCLNFEESEYLFLLPNGEQVKKIYNLIRYMSNEIDIKLPSATTVRKGGATAAAASCSEHDVRIVTRQLAHDPRVHNKYYECIRGKKQAKQAYDIMQSVVGEKEEPSKVSYIYNIAH